MDFDDFSAQETLASPHSPPHRFFTIHAKPTAHGASMRITTLIGVFIIAGEPPEVSHAAA
jgi:hypothetical protein